MNPRPLPPQSNTACPSPVTSPLVKPDSSIPSPPAPLCTPGIASTVLLGEACDTAYCRVAHGMDKLPQVLVSLPPVGATWITAWLNVEAGVAVVTVRKNNRSHCNAMKLRKLRSCEGRVVFVCCLRRESKAWPVGAVMVQ